MLLKRKGGRVFLKQSVLCRSLASKARGVMLKLSLEQAYVLEFGGERIIPLHMLLVFFPIDVLFLDKRRRVVEIKERFLPFTFYTPRRRAQFVVELPAGSVKGARLRLGDEVVW